MLHKFRYHFSTDRAIGAISLSGTQLPVLAAPPSPSVAPTVRTIAFTDTLGDMVKELAPGNTGPALIALFRDTLELDPTPEYTLECSICRDGTGANVHLIVKLTRSGKVTGIWERQSSQASMIDHMKDLAYQALILIKDTSKEAMK
jgi:hypothetical protein